MADPVVPVCPAELAGLSYVRPRTLDDAVRALSRPGAHVYAGGTDLLVALGAGAAWARDVRELVDIKSLTEARGIVQHGSAIRVGALVTAAELATSKLVQREAPVLAEAAAATSAPALRGRGTVGGNIVTPHPAGDVTTALLALDARVEVLEGGELRERALAEIFEPEAAASTRNRQRPLLLGVTFTKCRRSAFEKFGSRAAFSRSIVAAGVAIVDGTSRVALGGMSARPFVARTIGMAIDHGGELDAALAKDASPANDPLAPAGYRLQLARTLVSRAIARARRRRP